jgi:tripartite-type tricarboxylate transporter receptor subunit TctC
VQVVFTSLPSAIGYIKGGQLRALAVTTAKRSPVLSDVPAIAEFVPGYEATGWQGIGAPQKTSPDVIDRLNAEINAGVNDSKIGARLAELGGVPALGTPSDFKAFIAAEIEKWAKVVKAAGAQVD